MNDIMTPEQLKDLEKKLKEKTLELESFVKKNPLLSLGIAFGLGLIIMRFFQKKRS